MALKLWIPFVTGDNSTITDYTNYGYYRDLHVVGPYSDVGKDSSNNKVYGPYGNCIKTNTGGEGNNITLANSDIWDTPTKAFSFGAWFKFDPYLNTNYYWGAWQVCGLLGAWGRTYEGFGLGFTNLNIDTNYSIVLVARNGGIRTSSDLKSYFPDNVWKHVMITYDPNVGSGTAKVFVDGEEIYSTGTCETSCSLTSYLSARNFTCNYPDRWGSDASRVLLPFFIQDVRFYDEALSGGEIRRVMKRIANQYIHYKLDGFKADKSIELDVGGLKNNGSIHGTLTFNSESPRYSQCSVFSGSQYITVNDPISEYVYNNGMSCSIWFYSGSNTIVNIGSNILKASVSLGILTVNAFGQSMMENVSTNAWHHLVVTNDGSNVLLYIDGELKQTKTPTAITKTHTQIFIGAQAASTNLYSGRLSDFRLYAGILNENDVKKLYEEDAYVSKIQYGARELIEEDESSYKVTKTGTTKISEFSEINEHKTKIYNSSLEAPELVEY